jgi:hypothetical protein
MAELYKAGNQEKGEAEAEVSGEVQRETDEGWKQLAEKVVEEAGEHPRRELHGAYHVLPKERFVTQQQDEEIILLLRAHPIVNVGWILLAVFMVLIPTLLEAMGMFAGVPGKFMFVGKMTWYLVTWAFAFEKFLNWYYSIFLVTNERIIDIDFYNLMSRVVTHVNLNHIEEPVMGAQGFGSTIFNYGFVLVQTAGETSTVECRACPWPHKVVDIINRLAEELEKRRERGE